MLVAEKIRARLFRARLSRLFSTLWDLHFGPPESSYWERTGGGGDTAGSEGQREPPVCLLAERSVVRRALVAHSRSLILAR